MKSLRYFKLCFVFLFVVFSSACSARRTPVPPGVIPEQINVYSEDEQYGHEVLNNLTQQFPLDRDDARINRVRDIVDRLTKAAKADKNPWNTYVLVGDNIKNAAATRGNYIFVWTGILYSTYSDAELATILSHEIGHVLAGHTAQDPAEETNRIISGIAGAATSEIVGNYGLGGPVSDLAELIVRASLEAILVNPDSQAKEYEADQIGLFILADAGYDPDDAINFWSRIQGDPDFKSSPLEFLSSHPSTRDRLTRLTKFLEPARDRYLQATGQKPKTSNYTYPDSKSDNQRKAALGENTWEIMESKVSVYSQPDMKSSHDNSLKKGDRVKVLSLQDRWLEISEPVSGFIRSKYAAPVWKNS